MNLELSAIAVSAGAAPEMSLDSLRCIDRLCRGFEAALREGQTLSIDQVLADADASERAALCPELIASEVAFRFRQGDLPEAAEYQRRFPDHGEAIRAIFDEQLAAPEGRSSEETSPPSDTPAHLGDFRLVREIGRGGMGIVYQAEQQSLGRRVAVKVLPQLAGLDERNVRRFEHEARVIARLHHRHIVGVFGVGQHQGVRYIAMEYVPGISLDRVVKADWRGEPFLREEWQLLSDPSAPGRFRRIAVIGSNVARALQYAHEQGVLHRDIKPSNLLLDDAGDVRLTDFGLARLTDQSAGMTLDGEVLGTLRYTAPECFDRRSDARPDVCSDVYSLGVTLWELLTLQPAFVGESQQVLIDRILRGNVASSNEAERLAPRDLVTIVRKAMAPSSGDRYATAGELADDLERLLRDEPIRARRVTMPERLVRWCRREPMIAALAGSLGLILIVALLATTLLWRQAVQSNAAMETERNRASDAAAAADANADQARQAQQRADASRMAAEANLKLAQEAADVAVNKIVMHPELHNAGFHQLRLDLLATIEPLLVAISNANPHDELQKSYTARAWSLLSVLRMERAQWEESLEAGRRAVELYRQVATAEPTVVEHQFLLAYELKNYAGLLRIFGRLEESASTIRESIALNERHLAQSPENLQYAFSLADAYDVLATLGEWKRDFASAADVIDRNAALLEPLAERYPGQDGIRFRLARNDLSRASIARQQGLLDEAARASARARDVLEPMASTAPARRHIRWTLVLSRFAYAEALLLLDQWEAGEAEMQRFWDDYAALVRDCPTANVYRFTIASALPRVATIATLARRSDLAIDWTRKSIEFLEPLVSEFPNRRASATILGGQYVNLGISLVSTQPDEALEWYGKAISILSEAKQHEDAPHELPAFLHNAYGARALELERRGRYAEAARDAQAAIELSQEGPQRRVVQLRAASCLARDAQYASAVALADQAATADQLPPAILFELARVHALCARDNSDATAAGDRIRRCVELLQRADAAGCFQDEQWIQELHHSPDFSAARSDAIEQIPSLQVATPPEPVR